MRLQTSELFDKLLVIANGDADLVHAAIHASEQEDSADLKAIVDFIAEPGKSQLQVFISQRNQRLK